MSNPEPTAIPPYLMAELEEAARRAAEGIHDPLAPDIFPAEVASAIARAERRGIIPSAQGAARLADVLNTMPQLQPSLPSLLPRAFAISLQTQSGVFDCLYVALAEQEQCE